MTTQTEPRATAEARKLLKWLESHPKAAEHANDVSISTILGSRITLSGHAILRMVFPGAVAERSVHSNWVFLGVESGGIHFLAMEELVVETPEKVTL
jgi:hypothetical protein